jgi:hypothetical protein
MLIDRLLELELLYKHCVVVKNMEKFKLKDAVVFSINDSVKNYCPNNIFIPIDDNKISITSDSGKISQKLPFDNIVMNFSDGIEWAFQYKYDEYHTAIISTFINKSFYRMYSAFILVKNNMDVFISESIDYEGNRLSIIDLLKDKERQFNHVIASFGVIEKFTSILSCKNVRICEGVVPEKIQKKRILNGKLPLVSFKTLEVKKINNSTNLACANGQWSNRVHLCRGHMAEYGDEFGKGKLFGKYSGKFWISPCVKGDKKEGVIHKRYSI